MFIGCALPHALRAHRSFTRGTARGLLSAVVCMLGLAFAPAAWASTFYVSPAGKNSNAGTNSSAPWQTIAAVNKHVFQPGDTILFKAGDSFTGSIYMSPSEPGTASSPITVGSYGSGTATINAGSRDGFEAYDTGGFLIQNLKFTGSGSTKNSSSGVIFYNDLAGNVSEPHIYLAQVTVDGFGQQGVSIGGGNGASGYTDVNLSHVTAYDNGLNGIIFYGASEYANHDVYVGYSSAYDNYGKSGLAANSGSGIELGSVDGGTVEYSTAYGNGASNTATSGPVGIWTYDSNAVTIQYCESYDNQTAGGDGDGFDIDQNTTNSTVQYSYAHGNDGAGILLDQNANATGWGGNTVRFNISENDGRTIGFGGITLYGHVTGAQIYNNTSIPRPLPPESRRASTSSPAAQMACLRRSRSGTTSSTPPEPHSRWTSLQRRSPARPTCRLSVTTTTEEPARSRSAGDRPPTPHCPPGARPPPKKPSTGRRWG
jgi:hypothetical protein